MNTIKKRNQNYLYLPVLYLAIFIFSVATGCKKEYIDRYNTITADTIKISGKNHIESFTIDNFSTDTLLQASFVEDSIIIYWPAYRTIPTSIKPEIILPDSASISPASRVEVPFEKGIKYTVTSAAGTTKDYFLKIAIQQAPLHSRGIGGTTSLNTLNYYLWDGDQFLPDLNQTRVFMISTTDETKVYDMEVINALITGPTFIIPGNVPAGSYTLKATNGIYTVANANVVNVSENTTIRFNKAGIPPQLKRGEEFIIRGANIANIVTGVLLRNPVGSQFLNIEIIDNSKSDRITLKIPNDFPIATYNGIRLVAQGNKSLATDNIVIIE